MGVRAHDLRFILFFIIIVLWFLLVDFYVICFCLETVVGGFVGPSEPYGSVGGMYLRSADI